MLCKSFRWTHFIILLTVLLMAAMPSMQASALLTHCRSDPIFSLSNSDVINITLDISAAEANVRNVTYIIHVPAGVTLKKVTYTAAGIGTKETYKIYQDSPAKTYTTDTVVTTQNTGSIGVTATTRLNATSAKSVLGYNGQHLIVTLIKP